jgi:hypothetical protein
MEALRRVPLGAGLLAALVAAAYLIADPPSSDLAAHVYRTRIFEREGFALWNNGWYAGHHTPGYSVLFAPLSALVGPRVLASIAAVAAAIAFASLAESHFGERARLGALWFGAATGVNLFTGRLVFALGLAAGLAALLALRRGRGGLAVALAVVTALSSPVAAAFLALAGVAWAAAADPGDGRRAQGVAVAAGALAPVLALAAAFPEGGTFPFAPSSFWPGLGALAVIVVLLPRAERGLRIGVALYALACVAAFVIDTPMGGNAARLGPLFAGPLLACVLWQPRPVLLAALAAPLLYWQWQAPVRDVARARENPATRAVLYGPLFGFLERQAGPPFRVEVPFTRDHWDATHLGLRFPLARGWERQLDIKHNALFYSGRLTAQAYRDWLVANAVRFVAVPDAPLDYSARAEVQLISQGPPYLHPVWANDDWQVFEVRPVPAISHGAAALTALGADSFDLRARHGGAVTVQVRYTPYWKVVRGTGCVERAPGGWTRVRLTEAGPARVAARFSLGALVGREERCGRE